MNSNTLDLIRSNDHRTVSKVITNIENDKDISNSMLDDIYSEGKNTIRLGITGPPGSGKSTLTDQLIKQNLNDGKSVGVIAIDPTSPYTGGALLGDRGRMNNYDGNNDVFIRSMGSQGSLGGLAAKAQTVGDVIAASGKDIIIFETHIIFKAKMIEGTTPPAPNIKTILFFTSYFEYFIPNSKPDISVLWPRTFPFCK